jgi:hypothetical protein
LELREFTYEGGEAGFRILVVEPCSLPSPERMFQWEIKETSTRAGLRAYASYNFMVGIARLLF